MIDSQLQFITQDSVTKKGNFLYGSKILIKKSQSSIQSQK